MSGRGPGEPPTGPMLIVLGDAVEHGGSVRRTLYPAGQMRLILQGMLDRDLIDYVNPDEDIGPLMVTETGRRVLTARPEGAPS